MIRRLHRVGYRIVSVERFNVTFSRTPVSEAPTADSRAPEQLSAADANRILYAEIADTYDQEEGCVVDDRLRQHLRAALVTALDALDHLPAAPRVLDACGGSGNASLMLMALGLQPVTVDISPQMIAIFCDKAKARGNVADCVVAELGDFLRDDSREWDMIVFSSALHHLERPAEMLDLARTRTAPGGVIVTIFDPIQVGTFGLRLRRLDYLLHVVLHTPGRLGGLVKSRLLAARRPQARDASRIGAIAERHAVTGLDDVAILADFVNLGWRVIRHDRRYEGRFRTSRIIFRALRQSSSFSLVVQEPLAADGAKDAPPAIVGRARRRTVNPR